MMRYIYFLFLLLSSIPARTQILPVQNFHRENAFLVNPAIPAVPRLTEDKIFPPRMRYRSVFGLTHRDQWTNLGKDRPRTSSVHLQFMPLESNRIRPWVGLYGMLDRIGPSKFNGAYGTFGAQFLIGNTPSGGNHYLSAGITMGVLQYRLRTERLNPIHSGDPVIASFREARTQFDPGIGIYYTGPLFYTGLSLPRILSINLSNSQELLPQAFGVLGLYLLKNHRTWMLEPSIWIRNMEAFPNWIDINLKAIYRLRSSPSQVHPPRLWISVGGNNAQIYRSELGFQFNLRKGFKRSEDCKLSFAYSSGSQSRQYLGGIFEMGIAVLR